MCSPEKPGSGDGIIPWRGDPTASPLYYVNMARTVCTPEEVLIEFGIRSVDHPEVADPVVRIATTIPHAKRLVASLSRVMEKREKETGVADSGGGE